MEQTTLLICVSVILLSTIIYVIIINQQKLKLKLEIKRFAEPNDELKNYQKEIYELNKTELENRNKFDEKLSELKINYERQLNNIKIDFEKQKNELKEHLRAEKDFEYKKGFNQGVNSSTISVHVMPYKEIVTDNGFFSKRETVLIGYKYQLFSNGIPCFDAHIEVAESIDVKEIKEENIHLALSKIDEIISKIPNPNIQMVGNMKDFGKSLINLNKSKN